MPVSFCILYSTIPLCNHYSVSVFFFFIFSSFCLSVAPCSSSTAHMENYLWQQIRVGCAFLSLRLGGSSGSSSFPFLSPSARMSCHRGMRGVEGTILLLRLRVFCYFFILSFILLPVIYYSVSASPCSVIFYILLHTVSCNILFCLCISMYSVISLYFHYIFFLEPVLTAKLQFLNYNRKNIEILKGVICNNI